MNWGRAIRAADVAVVVLLIAWGQLQVWTSPNPSWQGDRTVHALLIAVITVPLLIRRRFPLVVAIAVAAASWVQFKLGAGLGQSAFAVALALYAVAAHARLLHAAAGGAAVAASILAVDVPRLVQGAPVDEVVPAWFIVAGIWAFGRWIRHRGAETRALREEARFLAHDRERRAQAAVADERARIARELHDLVAHSMGIIVLQAQGGQRVLERDPPAAATALASIERIGREGLAEMRRLLGILRHDEASPLAPAPAIEELDALVTQVRNAGLPVQLSIEGQPRPVPPGVGLSAYRIVQEALTNTLKHAGQARACVVLRYTPAAVEIDVSDDGDATPSDQGTGHGLVGMRERVALYGGTVEAGRRDSGGYQVRARLPLEPVPR